MCVEGSVHVCVCIHVHMCMYCYCTHTYSINLCHLLVFYDCLCVKLPRFVKSHDRTSHGPMESLATFMWFVFTTNWREVHVTWNH